jgi:hypothetical protein
MLTEVVLEVVIGVKLVKTGCFCDIANRGLK